MPFTFSVPVPDASSVVLHPCRAPVMVAIALIENGVSAEDAVISIREVRRGAINSRYVSVGA